jgi:septin family protein
VPTFNIMLAGASKTGKTSLARLLLQTCLVSPFPSTSSNPAQQVALAAFLRGSVRTTTMIESASLEIDEGPERIALTVLDTPGLLLGNDLDLERSVTSITRHLDARFAETLEEVRKRL